MTPAIRKLICYVPGWGAILFGIVAGLLQIVQLPFMKMLIGDSCALHSSEGLERAGAQFGNWRPATDADLDWDTTVDPPEDRYSVREATVDAYFHRVRLMLVRDKSDTRLDEVVHLEARWRVGYTILVISLLILGPIVVGWSWIYLLRGFLGLRHGHLYDPGCDAPINPGARST